MCLYDFTIILKSAKSDMSWSDPETQRQTKKLKLETDFSTDEQDIGHQIAIGSRIKSADYHTIGTVGPLIKIKETGELCFLTARNIFGPPQVFLDKIVIGTKVVHVVDEYSLARTTSVCGVVIATELTECLDVVLVKLLEEYTPKVGRFVTVTDEQLQKAGFNVFQVPSYSNDSLIEDARKITQENAEFCRVVKFGSETGLTAGKLNIETKSNNMTDHLIKKENPDLKLTQFLLYKQQFCVSSEGDDEFAKVQDIGSAVYLVGRDNKMHCIGMICQILETGGVLVTPIQRILKSLDNSMKKTLQLATFDNKIYQYGNPYYMERFNNALAKGKEHDRQIRINIVGYYNEGKSTLTRRLLHEPINDIVSTDGIEVHIKRSKIKENGVWESFQQEDLNVECIRRFTDVLKETPSPDVLPKYHPEEMHNQTLDSNKVLLSDCDQDKDMAACQESLDSESNFTKRPGILSEPSKKNDMCAIKAVQQTNFIKRVTENFKKKDDVTGNSTELVANIWDFGGQFIYYATHQIFHSRDAIYLLVFDLTKHLDDDVIDTDFPRKVKIENNLRFWVNSIHAFVGTENGRKPTIILVGTHKDKFTGNDDEINDKFEEIENLFIGSVIQNHFHEKHFAISNLDENEDNINELRKTIFDLAKETTRGATIPAKWIPLEDALLKSKSKKILKFQEVVELNEPFTETDDIKLFLEYHHRKGTLVYFDEEILSQYVIVDPQFLIDAFKCIITSKKNCRKMKELYKDWQCLTTDGIVGRAFIEEIWKTDKLLFENKDILLLFLQRHRILAELKTMDETTGELTQLGRFLIPCLLHKECQEAQIERFLKDKNRTSVLIGLRFTNNSVLSNIYERVTAAALGKWSPIHFENEALIFQNVGYYKLDARHAGRIQMKANIGIEMMVINLCKPYAPDPVNCDRFRRYVEQVIGYEFRKLHNEERKELFSYYVKCNDLSHDKTESFKSYELEKIKSSGNILCCPEYANHTIVVNQAIPEWFLKPDYPTAKVFEDRVLNEKDLGNFAQAIGAKWFLLGLELGLTADEMERIDMNHEKSGTEIKIFYMLKEWKKRNPGKDTILNLTNKIFKCTAVSVNTDKIRNVADNFLC